MNLFCETQRQTGMFLIDTENIHFMKQHSLIGPLQDGGVVLERFTFYKTCFC